MTGNEADEALLKEALSYTSPLDWSLVSDLAELADDPKYARKIDKHAVFLFRKEEALNGSL